MSQAQRRPIHLTLTRSPTLQSPQRQRHSSRRPIPIPASASACRPPALAHPPAPSRPPALPRPPAPAVRPPASAAPPSCSGTPHQGKGVKKGSWTPEKDKLLADFVQVNGSGNWHLLPQARGKNRCGKSCRLQWTNYLRPEIKRGSFTTEEHYCISLLARPSLHSWRHVKALDREFLEGKYVRRFNGSMHGGCVRYFFSSASPRIETAGSVAPTKSSLHPPWGHPILCLRLSSILLGQLLSK